MKRKILILGASGMVGHKLFSELSRQSNLDVFATYRLIENNIGLINPKLRSKAIFNVDAHNLQTVAAQLEKIKPEVVINCIGITKKSVDENNPLEAIEINSCFPHRLAHLCKNYGMRMIEIATDCVFSGSKGNYTEADPSDATDLYGRTKFLGEVYYPHCLTLRTSFIGHELRESHGLLEWFLAQENETVGFTRAIYSGLPTVLIAKVLANYILPNPKLSGLYQISSKPISKYDLLHLIAKVYHKTIKINPDDSVRIDRSLDSSRFQKATGYKPLPWKKMIEIMYQDYKSSYLPNKIKEKEK
jgi:dTDP-4-dehydrorhamnose reductase